jgi:hypothetical protein
MLTFSICSLSSCTCPFGNLQLLQISQYRSRQHLHQVRINAPVKGVSRKPQWRQCDQHQPTRLEWRNESMWVLTHRSKRSSRIASIGFKHLKVKATNLQVKLAGSKSAQGSCGQPMNQPRFLANFFLNLGGEIPVKGVRSVTP